MAEAGHGLSIVVDDIPLWYYSSEKQRRPSPPSMQNIYLLSIGTNEQQARLHLGWSKVDDELR